MELQMDCLKVLKLEWWRDCLWDQSWGKYWVRQKQWVQHLVIHLDKNSHLVPQMQLQRDCLKVQSWDKHWVQQRLWAQSLGIDFQRESLMGQPKGLWWAQR
jgi:hypothetical protein